MPDSFGLPEASWGSGYGSTWGTGNGLAAASSSSGGSGSMWIQAAGAALSFLGGRNDKKEEAKRSKEEMALDAMYGREKSQFDAEQAYYYKQQERLEKMRGLDQFRQFSTVKNYYPNYQNTNPDPIVIPEKPQYNQGNYGNTTPSKSSSSNSKGSGLFGVVGNALGI